MAVRFFKRKFIFKPEQRENLNTKIYTLFPVLLLTFCFFIMIHSGVYKRNKLNKNLSLCKIRNNKVYMKGILYFQYNQRENVNK